MRVNEGQNESVCEQLGVREEKLTLPRAASSS